MNTSDELSKIDFAIFETAKSSKERSTIEYLSQALMQYINLNHPGAFTKQNGARNYIYQVDKKSIDRELLKNIVKINNVKSANHYVENLRRPDDNFEKEFSLDELERKVYDMLLQYELPSIENIFQRYPKVYEKLVESFIDKRYFDQRYGIKSLDNPNIIDNQNQYLFDKIDSYYNQDKMNY